MAKQIKITSTKRFGPRYGRTGKYKLDAIEQIQRALYQCPSCKKQKVKRVSLGIWQCMSCGLLSTGKAYSYDSEITGILQDIKKKKELTINLGKDEDEADQGQQFAGNYSKQNVSKSKKTKQPTVQDEDVQEEEINTEEETQTEEEINDDISDDSDDIQDQEEYDTKHED